VASESLSALRDFASELAWHAGKLTLRYFQTAMIPERKADDSPVTIADRESERLMRTMIEQSYPAHSILGEEEGETRPGSAYKWILDPIDGTKSFVRGVPLYAVLVGLERDGEMIVGAINCPAVGDFLVAAEGEGCFWNGRRTHVSQIETLRESLVLTTDVAAMTRYGRGGAFQLLSESSAMQRTWSDAYGYVLVATGRAEVMLDPQMSVWDCGALLPVLREAGGRFTDWRGNATIYGNEAIGSNGLVHDELLALVVDDDDWL
jgi:histidinol phosphatase-like enzyme (inositol monophosphatase family)